MIYADHIRNACARLGRTLCGPLLLACAFLPCAAQARQAATPVAPARQAAAAQTQAPAPAERQAPAKAPRAVQGGAPRTPPRTAPTAPTPAAPLSPAQTAAPPAQP